MGYASKIGVLVEVEAQKATKALEEFSETSTKAVKKVEESFETSKNATSKVDKAVKDLGKSSKDLVKDFSQVTTSAWSLYLGYDKLHDQQVIVDKANLLSLIHI